MKISFPHFGNYHIVFKTLFEGIGCDVVLSEKTTVKDIEEGAKISPEPFCLPLKVNLGNYLHALKRGVDTFFMWENIKGSCRLRYYWMIQEKALHDVGFSNIKVLNFNGRNFFPRIKEIKEKNRTSWCRVIKTFLLSYQKLKLVEFLEERARWLRPREIIRGETEWILIDTLKRLDRLQTGIELSKLKKEIEEKFQKIKIQNNISPFEIGLIGEIYTVVDGAVNFDIEKKLGEMGAEVHREMSLSYFIKQGIFPWREWKIQKKIKPYLRSTVGGHGADAIYEMLNYVKKNFDGVIHLLPFGCMPEVTVRPILEKIHLESGIPFLSLSLDEQVAEAGINTRLEAFVDVAKNHHNRKTT